MLANASNNDRWGVRAVGALPWFQHPILFRKKVQTHRISEYDLILISCFCGLLQKSFVDWVKIHLSMMTSMMFEELYYEIRCKCNDFRANFGWMVQSFRWKWCSDFGIMAHRLRMNGALFLWHYKISRVSYFPKMSRREPWIANTQDCRSFATPYCHNIAI